MSYKTILVHVDNSIHAHGRYGLALSIAQHENAYLAGAAATGVSRFVQTPGYEGDSLEVARYLNAPIETMRKKAEKALDQFGECIGEKGVQSEKILVDDEAYDALTIMSRYSDLVIVGQADASDPALATMQDLPEYIALNSGRPVLVVPPKWKTERAINKIILAWDGSLSATRTLTHAIPLMRMAKQVLVTIFNPESKPDVLPGLPGTDITVYLARQGIHAEERQEKTSLGIGEALLKMATEEGADMIVMGCYVHTRFREILLGGATRSILNKSTLPVFMSH